MGLVKTRRLAAMHKQQRAKAGMKLPAKKGGALPPHLYKSGGSAVAALPQKVGIWYNMAMKGFVSMKNYILVIVVAVLAFEVWAVVGRQTRSYGYKPASGARRLGEGGASEVKAKSAAEKQVHAKAKEISAEKLELPKDATHGSLPIDLEGRIASLCGFEIGKIAKLPTHPKLDKDGNIIMTGKLAKPFRNQRCQRTHRRHQKGTEKTGELLHLWTS